MTSEEVSKRLHAEPDFINLKRFDYDMKKLMDRYPEGVPDRLIALALNITEEEVETIYEDIVSRIRSRMIV